MTFLNQAFYFFFAIVVFFILIGQIRLDHDVQFERLDDSNFWPIALILKIVGCLALGFSGFGYDFLLPIGNTGLTCSAMAITFLIYEWAHPGSKNLKYFSLIVAVVFAVFEVLSISAPLAIRVLAVSSVSWISYAWALWLLSNKKFSEGTHCFILKLVLIGKLVILSVRPYYLFFSDTNVSSVYLEQGAPALFRILGIASNIFIYIAIINILYQKAWLKSEMKAEHNELRLLETLNSLALARDNETGNHIIRTQEYVEVIALRLRQMGLYVDQLSDKQIHCMYNAAPLHDIGKVGIPDHILHKPGPLSEEEWEIMKTHPTIGESVLQHSEGHDEGNADTLQYAIEIAGGHHEKWNGSGYPRGLQGKEIPLAARIMAIADMYDALVSARVYKKEWTHEMACEEIIRNKGTHFDPAVVEAFILEKERFQEISRQYQDS